MPGIYVLQLYRILYWIFLTNCCFYSLLDAQQISITPNGQQVKSIGTALIFKCTLAEVPDKDAAYLEWRKPDGTTVSTNKGRIHVEKDGLNSISLYVSPLKENDAGIYTCFVPFKGSSLEEQIEIIIYEKIKFSDTKTHVQHRVGSSPLLPCIATGKPVPKISWRFQKQKVPELSDKYQYEEGGLRVSKISEADNGTYECRAEVESQGFLEIKRVDLNVLYAAWITVGPKDVDVIQGGQVELRCLAKGAPTPEYEWYKEQKMNAQYKVKVKLGSGFDKTSFIIKNVKEEDQGLYFCKAKNFLGADEATASVKLMYPPKIDELPHKVQEEGDILEMTCIASGTPIPKFTWQKVGSKKAFREGEQMIPRIIVDNTREGMSKLIISGVLKEDTGIYTCTATNPAGNHSRNATVTVQYEPSLLTKGYSTYSWNGLTSTFECEATGVPQPDITWFRMNQYLRPNDTFRIIGRRGSSILQIEVGTAKWVYGNYSCMAKNIRGHLMTTFTLIEAKSPSIPRNVTVNEETPTMVRLKASFPKHDGGPKVKKWNLKFKRDRKEEEYMNLYFNLDEVIKVDGLTPDTVYNFFLSAGNDVGFGKAVKFQVHTPPIKPKTTTAAPIVIEANYPVNFSNTDPNVGPHAIAIDFNSDYNHTALKSQKEKKVDPTMIKISEARERQEILPIGLIVGGVLSLIIIALLFIIMVLVIKKKSKRNPYGVKTVVYRPSDDRNGKDMDNMQLSIRRKDTPLPLPPMSPRKLEKKAILDKKSNDYIVSPIVISSPICNGHTLRPQSEVQTLDIITNPNSEANLAWQKMLSQPPDLLDSEEEEEMSPRYFAGSPENDLPPPPSFLLDGTQKVKKAKNDDYQDIFDAYHSGDDIDEVEVEEVDDNFSPKSPYGTFEMRPFQNPIS